ncbi:thiamine diphosphokinase [bacterium TMED277]|nr:MAG: thiamine diphosphokinase [bacterium TMED277]
MVDEKDRKLNFQKAVTLLGGAGFSEDELDRSLRLAPELVAADGGANFLKHRKHVPASIIGDFDSVEGIKKWESKGTKIIKIAEQNSTDFEKCIRNIKAPKFICLGFANERLDHFLAVCSALIKSNKPIFILGSRDLIFHVPTKFNFQLPIHSRISLYPLREISSMSSKGLKYPLKGIKFSPVDRIGTSNLSICNEIEVSYEGGGMLAILSKEHLENIWKLF